MLKVNLTGSFRPAVNGAESIEINAGTIRELLTKIVERYPRMHSHVEDGIAVSINGEIYRDNWSTPIPPDAEVYLIKRIQGG